MPNFREKEYFFDVEVIKETPLALLCEIEGEECWIPKSQIDDDSEVYDDEQGSLGTLIINKWFADRMEPGE